MTIVNERSRQQIDPVGTLAARPSTVILFAGAILVGLFGTLLTGPAVQSTVLAAGGLLLFCLVVGLAIAFTSPYRAPFHARSGMLILLGLVIAYGAWALGLGSASAGFFDSWPALGSALAMVALAPYRPTRETLIGLIVMTLSVGTGTFLRAAAIDDGTPPLVSVVVAVTPLIAIGGGGIAFSASLLAAVEEWQRRTGPASAVLIGELRDGIARSVEEDRVSILNREVLPFFARMLDHGEILEADRDRAREIAGSIRTIMVAEADRSWLETIVGADDIGSLRPRLSDPEFLASRIRGSQRTALRALIVAISDDPDVVPGTFAIRLHTDSHGVATGLVSAEHAGQEHAARSRYGAYFAVSRVVFTTLDLDLHNHTITMRFTYDQQR